MSCGCDDIHTCHAPLQHVARDIIFQPAYTNGATPATITDIGQRNVQAALEAYWSRVGIPVIGVVPTGTRDGVNISYVTPHEFIPNTLVVYLGGDALTRDADFVEHLDHHGFDIIVAPEDTWRLNAPPLQGEDLVANYAKRICYNTKGGT